VARDWRIVIVSFDDEFDSHALRDALESTPLDVDHEGDLVYCYGEDPDDPERTRQYVLEMLAPDGFGDVVETRIERWDEARHNYVDTSEPTSSPDPRELDPYEIAWTVVVDADAFHERELMQTLDELRRPVLGRSKNGALRVAASDASDAEALRAALTALTSVRAATAVPLSRFGRWRVREQLAGNYASGGDQLSSGPL
jgi:hypothetical protein